MYIFIHYSIFWIGYQFYKITKITLSYPYYSFRKLFVFTKGKINDNITESIKRRGKYKFPSQSGVLGNLSKPDIDKIVAAINKDGYYIFENKLNDGLISSLQHYALKFEGELIPPAADGRKKAKYDRKNLVSPRYQFDETTLLENKLIQGLTTDISILAIAQEYLGVKPIQDLTAMWWSTTFSKEASSEAAQLYHFDMDRFKFIKFFFYLTDVTLETGPHCYIRGTHKHLPEKLWRDGRILDHEIEAVIKKENWVEITGSKGSIIAVDTRGLHKGKPLLKGERLILQFEFANSLFGAPYQTIELKGKIEKKYVDIFKNYSYTFQRFKL
jgi:hypothetical protein